MTFRDARLNRMSAFLASIGISMTPGRVDIPRRFPAV